MSVKNPLTQAGIEPATFRFVAQHLNHCATAVLHCVISSCEILYIQVFTSGSNGCLIHTTVR